MNAIKGHLLNYCILQLSAPVSNLLMKSSSLMSKCFTNFISDGICDWYGCILNANSVTAKLYSVLLIGCSVLRSIYSIFYIHLLQVIMPNTVCESGRSNLFKMVSSHNPPANITTVQRRYFNETKGLF